MTATTSGHVVHVPDAAQALPGIQAAGWTDLPAGRVAVLARPAARRRRSLAHDLLAAVGVRADASGGAERDEGLQWLRAQLWLTAHRVRELIVLHAEWLSADVLAELLLLAAAANLRTWLVTELVEDDTPFADVLTGWTDRICSSADLTRELDLPDDNSTNVPAAPTQLPGPFPRQLPAEDFPSFRAACRRTLPDDQFTAVDELLAREAAALETALATGRPVSVQSVADWVHDRYRNLATDTELLTATRAAQVVLFRRGWFLQVDTPGLLAAAADCPRPASRTAGHWSRLAVYAQPRRGAICALAAADLTATEMAALRVGDITADGAAVTHTGATRAIETAAQIYLRAQLLERAADGAAAGAPLLVSDHGRAMATRPIADVLTRVRVETGLAFTSRRVARERLAGDRWQTRWGISLQPLTGARQ